MLKKLFIIVLSVIAWESVNAQYSNQIVRRLSEQEIAECETPASVAYNFVSAILQKNFVKMVSYIDVSPKEAQELDEYMQEHGETYETFFSKHDYVVGISSWLYALISGYEVVILNQEDVWLAKTDDGWMVHPDQIVVDGMVYIPGEQKPYVGIHEKKVYVACCPSVEINKLAFSDISRYKDTQAQIQLRQINNKWMVEGAYFSDDVEEEVIEEVVVEEDVEEEVIEEVVVEEDVEEEVVEEAVAVDDFMNTYDESYEEAVVSIETNKAEFIEGYVDLGLPSGTLWKDANESGLYNHETALMRYGSSLPTVRQWNELLDACSWIWTGSGYKVIGPNGNFIILPAEGGRDCKGNISGVGIFGDYWSDSDGDLIWEFGFNESERGVDWSENPDYYACQGHSVRIVR